MSTIKEQRAEAGAELGKRRGVYKKWVAAGQMSQEKADRQIALMADIYQTLKQLEDAPRLYRLLADGIEVMAWGASPEAAILASGHTGWLHVHEVKPPPDGKAVIYSTRGTEAHG